MSDELAPGEVGRSLKRIEDSLAELRTEVRDRHHKISNEVSGVVGPMSTLSLRMTNAENQIVRLDTDMRDMGKRAAWVAGVGATLAFVVSFLASLWKH